MASCSHNEQPTKTRHCYPAACLCCDICLVSGLAVYTYARPKHKCFSHQGADTCACTPEEAHTQYSRTHSPLLPLATFAFGGGGKTKKMHAHEARYPWNWHTQVSVKPSRS